MKHFNARLKTFAVGCFLALSSISIHGQAVQTGANCAGNSAGFEVQITEPHCKLINGSIEVNVVTNPAVPPMTFQWSTGATMVGWAGVSINNLAAGNYSVTGTDFRGCSVSYNISVQADTANVGFGYQVLNPLCTSNSGYIEVSNVFTGGIGPFSFDWSNGQTGWKDYSLGPGTYSLVLTDSAGCHGYRTWNLTAGSESMALDYVDVHQDYCHQDNGYISIGMVLSGGGFYQFQWSNGETGWDDVDLAPGVYSVTTSDIYGCTRVDSFTVTESSDTIPAFVTTTPTGCVPQGTASANFNSFYTVASFEWNNGSTDYTINELPAGTYKFTVTDVEGCVATASGTVNTSTTSAIIPGMSVFPATCQGGGLASSNPTGGVSPYQFLWNTGSTSSQIASLTGGVYSLHITDFLGCTVDTSFTLPDTTAHLMVSVETHNSHCVPDGWAVAHGAGGTVPYTFDWSNGRSGDTSVNMASGNYSVTLTDANGCIAYCYFVITPFTTDAVVPHLSIVRRSMCGRANGILQSLPTGGTSPYQFTWNVGGGSTGLSGTLQNIATGTYHLTVTDANGCTATASAAVYDSIDNLSANAVTVSIICQSPGAVYAYGLGGTAPYSYEWNAGGIVNEFAGGSELVVSVTGSYTVTITDANGCSISVSKSVVRTDSTLFLNCTSTPDTCWGPYGTAQVTVSGGHPPYSYDWGNGQSNPRITGLNDDDYSVVVKDMNGCSGIGEVAVGYVAIHLTVNITSGNALCDKDTGWATAAAGGGQPPYKYFWSNGLTTAAITGLVPGLYTVEIFDEHGCTGIGTVTILDNTAHIAPNITTVSAGCNLNNGSATSAPAGGTAPYSFFWTTGDVTASTLNLYGGVYDVLVTDANGCTAVGTAWVGNSNTQDSVAIRKPDCGAHNGSATAFAAGGAAPYTFQWSTGSTHDSINNIAAGRYSVTITDNNGCKIKDTIVVTASSDSLSALITVSNAVCTAHNGLALVTAHGGVFPMQYHWSNNATRPFIDSLSAGNYTVTITDANGCSVAAVAHVLAAVNAIGIGLGTTAPVCTSHNGSINAVVSGSGTQPYKYKWNNTDSTAYISSLGSGQYKITVTDAAGCSASSSVILSAANSVIGLNATATNTVCNDHTGTAAVLAVGGTAPYTYAWSNSSTLSGITGLDAGNYHLSVSDQNGCSATASVTVPNHPEPIATGLWTRQYPVCGDSSGQISVLPFNGTTPYTYAWSNGSTEQIISNLISGIYTVTIVDAIGCSAVQADTLPQNASGGLFASAIPTPSPCGQAGGSALAWVLSGNPPYNYAWGTSPVQTADSANHLAAGNYNLTVTDSKGCSATGTVAISNIGAPGLTMSSTPTNGGNNGTATATVNGTGNYTYHWNNGANTATITNLAAGTYNVTVSDGSGCESIGSIVVGSGSVSIGNIYDNLSLNLFPNPSNGTVFVTLELPQTGNVVIEWYNTLGERLMNEQLTGVYNLNKTYEFGTYAAGLYIMRVSVGEKTVNKTVLITR